MNLPKTLGRPAARNGLSLAALALFAASIAICRAAEEEYEPLAKGMEWIMDLQVKSPQGDQTNGVYHRKIGDTVELNGKTYFRSHTWLEGGRPFAMDYTKLVRKDAEGYYSIDERHPKRFEKKTANLPFAVGKQWDVKMENSTTNHTTVLSKEDFTAATNTYQNCFRIRTASASGDYTEEWLEAPGIGAVKSESKRPDGSTWVLILREFKKQ